MASRRKKRNKGSDADESDDKKEGSKAEAAPGLKRPERKGKGELRKPKGLSRVAEWVITAAAVGLAVGLVVIFRFTHKESFGIPVTLLHPAVDFEAMGLTQVHEDSTWFSLRVPYFQTLEYDSLQANDVIEIRSEGSGGVGIVAPGRADDTIEADGVPKYPKDLRDPDKFRYPLRNGAFIGELIGGVGAIVRNDQNVPHLEGTQLVPIGLEAYIVVPPDVQHGKLHLALNVKWLAPTWHNHWGSYHVRYKVYRKV